MVRHRPGGQAQIKRAKRHVRNMVRVRLARGEYDDLPTVALGGYLL